MNICICGCGLKCQKEYRAGHSNLNFCECGCGNLCKHRFLSGHNPKCKIYFLKEQEMFSDNFCQCGCGQKCKRNFVHGHNTSKIYQIKSIHLCQCGCGKECKRKFVNGHNGKGKHANLGKHVVFTKEQKASWTNLCKCGCRTFCNKQYVLGHNTRGMPPWNMGLTKSQMPPNMYSAEVTFKKMQGYSGHRRFSFITKNGTIVQMRSSWEVFYAQYLEILNIIWKYESEGFLLSNGHRYFPDFYLPELDEYHEIKGYMRPSAQEKLDLFRKEYPDKKLIILKKDTLKNLGIL